MSCLKEINQTNTRYKSPTSLKQTFSYRDVQEYTDICFPSASRMQFLSFQKWCSANVFFLSSTRNMCPGKFVKQLRFFGCVARVNFLILSELRFVKRVRFFEQNCIAKRVTFFASFC